MIVCEECGRRVTAKRPHKRYCSQQCRQRANRRAHSSRTQTRRTIICEQCKRPVEAKHPSKRFCSKNCWELAHRRGPGARPRAGTKVQLLLTIICEECKRPVEAKRTSKRYCSPGCCARAHQRRHRRPSRARGDRRVKLERGNKWSLVDNIKLSTTRAMVCPQCDNAFTTKHPNKRFCSPSCQEENYHGTTRTIVCSECGETATTRRRTKRFCSKACQKKGTQLKTRTIVCPQCGKTVTTRHWAKRFCSIPCQRNYKSAEHRAAGRTRVQAATGKPDSNKATKKSPPVVRECVVCGDKFRRPSSGRRLTCFRPSCSARKRPTSTPTAQPRSAP